MSKLRILYCEDGWTFKRSQEQTEMQDLPLYVWMIEARKEAQIIWGYESLPDDNPEDAAAAHAQGATPEEYILDIGNDLELNRVTKYWMGSWGI